MKWTDLVFSLGSVVFIVGLLPAVLDSRTRIPLKTSLPTGAVLVVYGLTFALMGLWLSAASSLVTASMWLRLVQRGWSRGESGN